MKFIIANAGCDNWRMAEADTAEQAVEIRAKEDERTRLFQMGSNGVSTIYSVAPIGEVVNYTSVLSVKLSSSVSGTIEEIVD